MRTNIYIYVAAVLLLIHAIPFATLVQGEYVDETTRSITITVGKDQVYTSIQEAINAASSGDTIIVKEGTYNESVSITKRLILRSESGKEKTTIDCDGYTAVYINTTYCIIDGFNITGHASDTNPPKEGNGIIFTSRAPPKGSVIENCDIYDFGSFCIDLWNGDGVIIRNTLMVSHYVGIQIQESSNTILDNCLIEARHYGIGMNYGDNNTITNSTIKRSNENIQLYSTVSNLISYNNITHSNEYGINLYYNADDNRIIGNNIINNSDRGITISTSSGNYIVHNNFINNNDGGIQAVGGANTIWDDGKKGNYWSDYRSRYPSAKELPDGTYDTPYSIYDQKDNHPLVSQFILKTPPEIIFNDDLKIQTIPHEASYYLKLEANDLDTENQDLKWSLKTNASFLSIDENDRLGGYPLYSDIGSYWVNVSVSDGTFYDWVNFTLVIEYNKNFNLPRILNTDVTQCMEDVLYSITYQADYNHTIFWDLTTNATFLDIDPDSGYLNGTPTNNDVGTYRVNVSVTDATGTTFTIFNLTVINVNDPPAIITQNNKTAIRDVKYYVNYDAIDIDPTNDVLIWSVETNCSLLQLSSTNGILSGTPSKFDLGSFWVNISVNDGNGGNDYMNFTITVMEVEEALLDIDPDIRVFDLVENTSKVLSLNTSGLDLMNLTIIWSIQGIGEIGRGASVNISIPNGTYNLTIRIVDNSGNWVEKTIQLEIGSRPGNPYSGIEFGSNAIIIAIIISLVLIILIIGYLFIYRRRKNEFNLEDRHEEAIQAGKSIEQQGPTRYDFRNDIISGNLDSFDRTIKKGHLETYVQDDGGMVTQVTDLDINGERYIWDLQKKTVEGKTPTYTKQQKLNLKESLFAMKRNDTIGEKAYNYALDILEE